MEHPDDKLEKFYARVLIAYKDGGDICYIYNREVLDGMLNIKRHHDDKSQFISLGDILTIDKKKYKVVDMNFKLFDHIHDMVFARQYGVNAYSPSEPTNFNLQIGVFVELMD